MSLLTLPEVVSCCVEEIFPPQVQVMRLRWAAQCKFDEPQSWTMPLGLVISSPVPTRFGIRILRTDEDRYVLHLVWDRTALAWGNLTRSEVTNSILASILAEMGTDLDYLLDQPVLADCSKG